jgi:uncharacterized protein YjbI with pentapeptide repeats
MAPSEVLSLYSRGIRDFRGLDIDSEIDGDEFRECVLEHADFTGACIIADFTGASLRGTCFRESNLKTCVFDACNLADADFTGAALCATSFRGAVFDSTRFQGAYYHSYVLERRTV